MLTVNAVEVQKHRLKGPVGYTVVGNPTIVDGVVSGFSNSNYLGLPNISNAFNPFEVNVQFTMPTSVPSGASTQTLFQAYKNAAASVRPYVYAFSNGNGQMYVIYRDYTDESNPETKTMNLSSTSLLGGNTYSVNMQYENGVFSVSVSNNSQVIISATVNAKVTLDSVETRVGQYRGGTHFLGSIDLNQTYIKVNGKLWFYQPADTKYIVKDGKLVWADPRLALSGPVNYSVVGSPMVADGVVSGFSDSNYLRTGSGINLSTNADFELCVNFKTNSFPASGNKFVFCAQNSPVKLAGAVNANQKFGLFYVDSSGTRQIIYSSNTISANTEIKVIIKKTGNTLNWVVDGIDQTALTSDYTGIPAFYIFFGKSVGSNEKLDGSIDLKETYIKVNNQLWFYGKNYATQHIAPVPAGYTFGNTTTPSIGYVDMRTQQFTAAPQGATIGRDEE